MNMIGGQPKTIADASQQETKMKSELNVINHLLTTLEKENNSALNSMKEL